MTNDGDVNILLTTVLRIQKALGCEWEEMLPASTKRFN
jgi:hypothetical protein